MVQHTASRGHSTGGDDDARRFDIIDGFRFFDRAREVKFVHVQRIALAVAAFLARVVEVVVLFVFQIQIRGAQSHGAVDEHREAGNSLLVFELAQVVHEGLRAPDGKRRNHDGSAALRDAVDDVSQQLGRVTRRVFRSP